MALCHQIFFDKLFCTFYIHIWVLYEECLKSKWKAAVASSLIGIRVLVVLSPFLSAFALFSPFHNKLIKINLLSVLLCLILKSTGQNHHFRSQCMFKKYNIISKKLFFNLLFTRNTKPARNVEIPPRVLWDKYVLRSRKKALQKTMCIERRVIFAKFVSIRNEAI